MLIAAKHMYGAPMEALDGTAGTLYDVLFDDASWKVQHMVVTTDRWFFGEQIVMACEAIARTDWTEPKIWLRMTKNEVRECPTIQSDRPIIRIPSSDTAKNLVSEAYTTDIVDAENDDENEPHVHSTKMLTGMHVHCADSHQLGHIEDFIVDDESWAVRELLIDTRNWLPGKRVLIEPSLIKSINWEDREVYLALPRDQIEHRPAYDQDILSDAPVANA